MAQFRATEVARIRARVKDGRVICGLSGGVDSAVAALLIHEAIGDQLTCIFVDHGLLRENEARYRSLFEGSLDPIFAVDGTGRFVTANPAAVRVSGYSPQELMTKTFAELCAPDQLAATQAAFGEALAGVAREIETAMIRKDGCDFCSACGWVGACG